MATSSPQVEYTQEVRFAVVMYGGVSLAIYINGIAQEMLSTWCAPPPLERPGILPIRWRYLPPNSLVLNVFTESWLICFQMMSCCRVIESHSSATGQTSKATLAQQKTCSTSTSLPIDQLTLASSSTYCRA